MGTVRTKDIPIVSGTQGRRQVMAGSTFDVIDIATIGNTKVYVTNTWYNEHSCKPLLIPVQLAEEYTPLEGGPGHEGGSA